MKKTELLKFAAIALLSTGLIAGCASETQPAPATETEQAGPSAAAKNAIYSAKLKLARAQKLGYEWRDTAKIIKEAEKAAAAGDNDKAIALANKAAKQSDDAIAQYHSETKRFNERFGTVSGTGSMMTSAGEYTVVRGDNLWDISGKDSIYGNPYQWPLIYKANADQIKDADLIYPGQVFEIPNASASEIDAAIQHAKTRGAWSIGVVEESDKQYLAQ